MLIQNYPMTTVQGLHQAASASETAKEGCCLEVPAPDFLNSLLSQYSPYLIGVTAAPAHYLNFKRIKASLSNAGSYNWSLAMKTEYVCCAEFIGSDQRAWEGAIHNSFCDACVKGTLERANFARWLEQASLLAVHYYPTCAPSSRWKRRSGSMRRMML